MSAGEAEAFKVLEAEGWGAQAGTYRGLTGAITSQLAESLLDAAGVRSDWRVLDVATGPGYVAERAAARGARAVGVDLAEGMLELARQRVGGVELRARMPSSFHSMTPLSMRSSVASRSTSFPIPSARSSRRRGRWCRAVRSLSPFGIARSGCG
jgi:SAM-dependent methyltransferase